MNVGCCSSNVDNLEFSPGIAPGCKSGLVTATDSYRFLPMPLGIFGDFVLSGFDLRSQDEMLGFNHAHDGGVDFVLAGGVLRFQVK